MTSNAAVTAIGIHQRRRRIGGGPPMVAGGGGTSLSNPSPAPSEVGGGKGEGGGGRVGSDVSISMLTIWAAVVAVSAIALLIAADVRQPARRSARRGRVPTPVVPVVILPTPPYRRPPLWRRLLSLLEAGALTVVMGLVLGVAILALIVTAFLLLGRAVG